jgi:putative metalloprotease
VKIKKNIICGLSLLATGVLGGCSQVKQIPNINTINKPQIDSDIDYGTAISAGTDLLKAASLSDSEIVALSLKSVEHKDKSNIVLGADSRYYQRLARLTKNLKEVDGLKINYKIYQSKEINAFAMPDGSVRVYTGLMDYMSDKELMGVIGHEIGHVKLSHGHKKMKLAYTASAARKGVAANNNLGGALAASEVGGFVEKVLKSQFSQSQESAADEYGLELLNKTGYDPRGAIMAMEKLAEKRESQGKKADGFSLTSTHPAPRERAKALKIKLAKLEPQSHAIATSTKEVGATPGQPASEREIRTNKQVTAGIKPSRAGWYVQVKAAKSMNDAMQLSNTLRQQMLPVYTERAHVKGTLYYRIMIGPFPNKRSAISNKGQVMSAIAFDDEPFLRRKR